MTPDRAASMSAEAIADILLADLRERPASSWLPDPRAVVVVTMADGVYHANFTVESGSVQVVARVVRSSQWGLSAHQQLEREFAVLHDLVPSGVAPKPLALVATGPVPFLVESMVPGTHMDYDTDLSACAVAIAAAHRCPPTRSRTYLDPRTPPEFLLGDSAARLDSCRVTSGNARSVQLLRSVHDRLARTELIAAAPVLVHTDLIQKNMLVEGATCSIIDWEGARVGGRAWDLAYLLSPVTVGWADPARTIDAADRTAAVKTYCQFSGVSASALSREIQSVMPFVLLRALAWCVDYASSSIDDPIPTQMRLATFTSEDFIAATFAWAGLRL